MSRWNLWLDAMLKQRALTVAAHRLVLAIARETLGYGTSTREIGQDRLRRMTGLDGRSFLRARQELIEAALITLVPGSRGRGHRDVYTVLPAAEEMPADERALANSEKPARKPAGKPAQQRGRIEERGRRTTTPTAEAYELAALVLADFSAATNASFRAEKYRDVVAARISEHPELSRADHADILESTLRTNRWWNGATNPGVIYARATLFEQALATRNNDHGAWKSVDDV